MKFSIATLVLLTSMSPLVGAEEPLQQEESASATLALTRPGDGGVFAAVLRNHLRQQEDERPFEWKKIDEEIDEWFAKAESRFPEDFKKHAGNWKALREQSKHDARTTLSPIEQTWKDSVSRAATDFETSEADFYARNPRIRISGTYRYFEGHRAISGVEPSWKLDQTESLDIGSIQGEDIHDTGEIVLKAAGMNHPMFSLKCAWTLSLEASIDPASLEARAVGAINSPTIRAHVDPRFNGKSNRKITHTWGYYDKSSTPIGPVKLTIGNTRISTSLGLGTGFTYGALDPKATMPMLQAGVDDSPRIE